MVEEFVFALKIQVREVYNLVMQTQSFKPMVIEPFIFTYITYHIYNIIYI